MKTLVFLCALIGAAMAEELEYYKTPSEHIDIPAVVEDPKKLQELMDCFLDRQPCSKVHANFLALIPETIKTACAKCNSAQKQSANIFLTGLRNKMPRDYDDFVKKFDPEGKYMDTLFENIKGF
ncbi:allergen Tha p 1-like [Zerene cesonia]|uniref:allergen Tha p 1-like n=1 Tax=Zerene cesonia TaxID=33412 RepID=UPI0018E56B2E|nr:allergen Tha p 1-like [Zerene cesonia]